MKKKLGSILVSLAIMSPLVIMPLVGAVKNHQHFIPREAQAATPKENCDEAYKLTLESINNLEKVVPSKSIYYNGHYVNPGAAHFSALAVVLRQQTRLIHCLAQQKR